MDAFQCTTQTQHLQDLTEEMEVLVAQWGGENYERQWVKERFRLTIEKFCFPCNDRVQWIFLKGSVTCP